MWSMRKRKAPEVYDTYINKFWSPGPLVLVRNSLEFCTPMVQIYLVLMVMWSNKKRESPENFDPYLYKFLVPWSSGPLVLVKKSLLFQDTDPFDPSYRSIWSYWSCDLWGKARHPQFLTPIWINSGPLALWSWSEIVLNFAHQWYRSIWS